MNVKAFLVDALGGALDLGVATPDDVLRHVTPDLLAEYLPRPLWARLLTACLGAPRVDAQLVVETIGVPNLCEHLPSPIIWSVRGDHRIRGGRCPYAPGGEADHRTDSHPAGAPAAGSPATRAAHADRQHGADHWPGDPGTDRGGVRGRRRRRLRRRTPSTPYRSSAGSPAFPSK
jgi:hypothetical protein